MSFVIVPVCYEIQISSKSDYIALKCGDMTVFKVAIVRHFEFSNLTFVVWCLTIVIVGFRVNLQNFAKFVQYAAESWLRSFTTFYDVRSPS